MPQLDAVSAKKKVRKPEGQAPAAAAADQAPAPEAAAAPADATAQVAPKADDTDSYAAIFPEPTVAVAPPSALIAWIALVLVSGAALAVGYRFLSPRLDTYLAVTPTPTVSQAPSAAPTATASASPSPTADATPTPSPSASPDQAAVDPGAVSLRVLNGTTVSGKAAAARDALEQGGFTVKSIGNAAHRTYAQTYVYYQAGRQAEAEAVAAALSGYATVLQESSLADPDMVLVVTGTK